MCGEDVKLSGRDNAGREIHTLSPFFKKYNINIHFFDIYLIYIYEVFVFVFGCVN